MNNNRDNLEQLWQQQQVSPVDTSQLKQQWRLMRSKQYLYVLLDALSTGAIPAILFLYRHSLSMFEFIWISALSVLFTGWFIYTLWLRRYSLGMNKTATSTSDFVEQVKRQYRQNMKIAYVNKLLCYLMPFIFASYFAFGYLGNYIDQAEMFRKGSRMLLFNLLCLPFIWIWADRRQKKFAKLLAGFEARWSEYSVKDL
ncbi:hypothetical protein [Aliiglaciecola sp. LCG003]|uniref:hypothetical protein n=1 Tax=Aliiglaciecola sp. LCG003 TaxID=3053655 RepID=UPI002573C76C|nr:hypothetical protein [Aliiglaciecola sp. LCG003]WJG09366.1 hypothetical protein QR722_18870 [Aliiglaciecola sp. LCG003]